MPRTVEILLYTLKPGTGREFHAIMSELSVPLHEHAGMDVVAHGVSAHDADAYFLIRAYASLAHLETTQTDFYASDGWRNGPRAEIISRIASSQRSVVVMPDDAVDALRHIDP